MVIVGKITGQSIATNLDGSNKVRLLQVEITDDDAQEIQALYFSGEDNAPVDGATAYIIQISSSFKLCIGIDDGIEPTIDAGERKIYSQAAGAIKAFTHWKENGNQEINGSGDFAVRYNELKSAYDTLKTDLNNLITAYNLHIHVTTATIGATATPGTIAPTTSQGTPSTADMAASKVASVELPS